MKAIAFGIVGLVGGVALAAAPGRHLSGDYLMTVDGRDVDVVSVPTPEVHIWNKLERQPYSYAPFVATGTVEVCVKSGFLDLSKTEILPDSKGVTSVSQAVDTVVFRMTPPMTLVLEPRGRHRALVVSANLPEANPPKKDDPKVKYYGPGIHHAGKIALGDGETLYLAPGAWVEGAVRAKGRGVTICGSGVLSGACYEWRCGPKGKTAANTSIGCLACLSGENITVRDATFFSSWGWTLVFDCVTNALVDNVKVICGRVINDDGIDICSARDVVLRNSFIRCQDDCIAPKWWCENLVCTNMTLWTDAANAFRTGYECEPGPSGLVYRNLLFKDIDVLHLSLNKASPAAYWANCAIYIQPTHGQLMENTRYEDIRFHEVGPQDVFLNVKTMPITEGSARCRTDEAGVLKGLVLRNVYVPDARGGMCVNLSAHDDAHPIEGVRFETVTGYGPVKTSGKVDFTVVPDLVVYEGGPIAWGDEPLTFKGPWDLTTHGTIAVDVENTSATDDVRLALDLADETDARFRTAMIPAGFKGTVEIDVCPPLAHPEVVAKMKLLQSSPFAVGTRNVGARTRTVLTARVPSLTLIHYSRGRSTAANGAMPTVLVRRVVAKDTSKRKWPAWYAMDEKAFFPFVDRYGQFKYRDWPRKVKSDADLKAAAKSEAADLAAHPSCGDWDEFGGWAKGPKREATGRFRLEKVDGKWWFVDPVGNLWWSHGVVRVTPSSAVTPLDGREHYFADLPRDDAADPLGAFYHTFDELLKPYYGKRGWTRTYDFSAANLMRKYGDDWRTAYADLSHRRLRSWGLNTIANSSDRAIRTMNRTPWIERLETRGPKCKEQKGEGWWHVPDPYHPEFRRYFRALLESRRAELSSPYCAGVFVDNEHDWRGISDRTVREYFKVIRDEIKRFDPKLLYFGCRFAGKANARLVGLCAEFADAISYNIYAFRLDTLKLPEGVDKPILIGEFHFGSTADTGLFNPSLIPVDDQSRRARAYKRYVTDALLHPNVVGTHWHQFSDQPLTGRFDGEDFNVGFTDVCDTPYPEMRAALREVGETLYKTRMEGTRK